MGHNRKKIVGMVVGAVAGLIIALSSQGAEAGYIIYTRIVGFNIMLAGHDLNGVSLNGTVLDDQRIQSVSTTNVELNDKLMESVWIKDSYLVGSNWKGQPISRNKMVGAVFAASLENGDDISLRIEDVRRHDEKSNHDVWLYEVSYETDSGWLPLCGEDEMGNPVPAIPLAGVWDLSEGTETGGSHMDDDSVFTFACQGYVIAKCVEAGYKPWKKTKSCVPGEGCEFGDLSAHHQACTRMLRADYCGDGNSNTVDDTEVNFYDELNVRYDSVDWEMEAEWDEDGAVCAVRDRIPGEEPTCMEWLEDDSCGDLSHFDEGTLLFSEAPPLSD